MGSKSKKSVARQAVRERCYSRARFLATGNLAYVRDVTEKGCKFVFLNAVHLEDEETLSVEMLPIIETEIPRFEIKVKIHWKQIDKPFYVCGASFVDASPQAAGYLTRFVEILQATIEQFIAFSGVTLL